MAGDPFLDARFNVNAPNYTGSTGNYEIPAAEQMPASTVAAQASTATGATMTDTTTVVCYADNGETVCDTYGESSDRFTSEVAWPQALNATLSGTKR